MFAYTASTGRSDGTDIYAVVARIRAEVRRQVAQSLRASRAELSGWPGEAELAERTEQKVRETMQRVLLLGYVACLRVSFLLKYTTHRVIHSY